MTTANSNGLLKWGWNTYWDQAWNEYEPSAQVPGRVVSESRGAFEVVHQGGVDRAVPLGKLRKSGLWPAVGDWVSLELHTGGARMTRVLPRRTCLRRKAAGESEDIQVMATNIDTVFLVTSMNSDLNPRRLERFFVAARDSAADVSLIFTKFDLANPAEADSVRSQIDDVSKRLAPKQTFVTSSVSKFGIEELQTAVSVSGHTSVFLGTSGVGKSSLLNALMGEAIQDTGSIREDDDKGRHTTTGRNAFLLPGGGILIDSPGIRELQLAGEGDSVDEAFGDVEAIALRCKFTNCQHENERGCAIQAALDSGDLDKDRLRSYRKLLAEARSRENRAKGRRR